ncbi:hypothetical protein BC835DRAFT_444835 [Cytidiella melzeri]|nr:hypothetical protein BC835DRAFT_444835 [Cytidiella melzeri]
MSFLYFALALMLFSARTVHAGDVVRLDSLISQCQFMVDGYAFNLCPLFASGRNSVGKVVKYERQTPPSTLTGTYRIRFEGELRKNEKLADNMQCPAGTTICLTTSTRYSDAPADEAKVLNVIPVAGALTGDDSKPYIQRGRYTPGLNIDAEMVRIWNATDDSLKITMHGGYYVYQKQQATIHFICDQDSSKQALRFIWSANGDHIFTWRSPHGCAQSRQEPSPPSDGPGDSDESDGDGEFELVDPSFGNRARQSLWTLIAITSCVTAAIAYLIYFPPRKLRRFVSKFLKKHTNFRVGENVLVRWAHDEIDLEEDGPLFINGDDISNDIEDEENIPLKPSPRKVTFTTYGTA